MLTYRCCLAVLTTNRCFLQAIGLLDDLDKELNTYAMRVREWYGWHFPEMTKIVSDNIAYAKAVRVHSARVVCGPVCMGVDAWMYMWRTLCDWHQHPGGHGVKTGLCWGRSRADLTHVGSASPFPAPFLHVTDQGHGHA